MYALSHNINFNFNLDTKNPVFYCVYISISALYNFLKMIFVNFLFCHKIPHLGRFTYDMGLLVSYFGLILSLLLSFHSSLHSQ